IIHTPSISTMRRFVYSTIFMLPLLVLGGCDLFESSLEEIVVEATGTVVSAETGEPIGGLGVAIQQIPAGFSASVTVATAETDAEGRFDIRHEASRVRQGHPNNSYAVEINVVPYDDRYGSFRRDVFPPPDVHLNLGVIELEETEVP